MRYQPLVVVLAGICAGIIGDRELGLSLGGWLVGGVVIWIAWLVARKLNCDRLAAATLIGVLIAVGGCWHHCYWHYFGVNEIERFARESPAPVCLEAIATAGPRRIPPPPADPLRPPEPNDRTRLSVRVSRIRIGDQWRSASGNALVLVEGDVLGVHAGDRLQIF